MPASPEGARLPWHLLVEPAGRPGWWQMATDRALLDLAAGEGACFVRLYAWEPWCLSFGAHEPATRRYDRDRIAALGLDTVRRPTGGRAVWHADELTYAVAAPAEALGSLPDAYRAIHAVLAEAVTTLGFPAALAPAPAAPQGVGSGACFSAPAGGELLVAGRKVAGSAQVRADGALLQHGSLLLGTDQRIVHDLTLGPPAPPGEACLADLRGAPVSWAEAAEAVAEAMAAWQGTPPTTAGLAERLAVRRERWISHFRDPAWTWQR